jgi:hypothetical protein
MPVSKIIDSMRRWHPYFPTKVTVGVRASYRLSYGDLFDSQSAKQDLREI